MILETFFYIQNIIIYRGIRVENNLLAPSVKYDFHFTHFHKTRQKNQRSAHYLRISYTYWVSLEFHKINLISLLRNPLRTLKETKAFTEPFFTKIIAAKLLLIQNSYTEFHENSTD
jgi:hypothetical protein